MFCSNCGKDNSDSSAFCAHCGFPLSEQNESEGKGEATPIKETDNKDKLLSDIQPDKTPKEKPPVISPTFYAPPIIQPKKKPIGLIIALVSVSVVLLLVLLFTVSMSLGYFSLKHNNEAEEKDTEKIVVVTPIYGETNSDTESYDGNYEEPVQGNSENILPTNGYVPAEQRYVSYSDDFSSGYCPCLVLYPDGQFLFIENLLSAIGRITGEYELASDIIVLYVTSSYDSSYAGADASAIIFQRNSDGTLSITQDLCGTFGGSVFARNDTYSYDGYDLPEIPSGEITYPYKLYNPSKSGVVSTGNAGLNMRKGPGTSFDKITLLRDDSLLCIYGCDSSYSWLFVMYDNQYGWVNTDWVVLLD